MKLPRRSFCIWLRELLLCAEFESVRVQMRKLYARFERQVFAIASL
jgi:hypothetical protein